MACPMHVRLVTLDVGTARHARKDLGMCNSVVNEHVGTVKISAVMTKQVNATLNACLAGLDLVALNSVQLAAATQKCAVTINVCASQDGNPR